MGLPIKAGDITKWTSDSRLATNSNRITNKVMFGGVQPQGQIFRPYVYIKVKTGVLYLI